MNIREYGISLISKISRERFFQYYKELERNQWIKKEEIERRQLTKLKNLLNYAVENISFYQEKFRNINIMDFKSLEDLKQLPILSKNELKSAGQKAIARNRKKLISKSTSGTTGPPFNFVVDRDFFSLEIARNQRIFNLPGIAMGEPWVLFTPLRGKKSSIFSCLNNRLVLDANQITTDHTPPCCPSSVKNRLEPDENMIRHFCKRLKQHKPKAIYSYPSSLIALATFIRKWDVAGIKISTLISSGEVLTSETRNFIEGTFDGEVFNLYGTTEFPAIAEECKEHNGLHIFTDSYIVEFINPLRNSIDNDEKTMTCNQNYNSSLISNGVNGEIVITDLDNYTMPFIRYQTGDSGFLKNGQCRCGRNLPLMEINRGRKSDLIITPDGKFLRRSFFTALLQKNEEIEKSEINQNEQGRIMISILLGKQLPESRKDFLIRRCRDYAGNSIDINIANSPNLSQ